MFPANWCVLFVSSRWHLQITTNYQTLRYKPISFLVKLTIETPNHKVLYSVVGGSKAVVSDWLHYVIPIREELTLWPILPLLLTGNKLSLIARFMGPTWGPPGADRTQVGPMLAPWTLLSGVIMHIMHMIIFRPRGFLKRFQSDTRTIFPSLHMIRKTKKKDQQHSWQDRTSDLCRCLREFVHWYILGNVSFSFSHSNNPPRVLYVATISSFVEVVLVRWTTTPLIYFTNNGTIVWLPENFEKSLKYVSKLHQYLNLAKSNKSKSLE